MRPYIISLLALFISFIALAAAASQDSRAANETTRIETDQQANMIRIIIDGQERAVIDADGLHVNGDIDYSGTLTDTGGVGFDRHVIENGEKRDAP
jgi:hypothetical protein